MSKYLVSTGDFPFINPYSIRYGIRVERYQRRSGPDCAIGGEYHLSDAPTKAKPCLRALFRWLAGPCCLVDLVDLVDAVSAVYSYVGAGDVGGCVAGEEWDCAGDFVVGAEAVHGYDFEHCVVACHVDAAVEDS